MGKILQKGCSGIRNKKVVKDSKSIEKAHHETSATVKSKLSIIRLPHTTVIRTNAKLCRTEKMCINKASKPEDTNSVYNWKHIKL